MAFLGMNSVLDVDVARGIRVIDRDCPLFFVSDIPDFGIEAFRVGALDYLVKPVTAERVGEAVSRMDASQNCMSINIAPDWVDTCTSEMKATKGV